MTSPVGALGFCLGGTLTFALAGAADPATAVCYYGAGIPDMLGDAGAVAAEHPGWESHVHPDGGHAFGDWDNPMFHRPQAAARAWEQTRAFLRRTLPA